MDPFFQELVKEWKRDDDSVKDKRNEMQSMNINNQLYFIRKTKKRAVLNKYMRMPYTHKNYKVKSKLLFCECHLSSVGTVYIRCLHKGCFISVYS